MGNSLKTGFTLIELLVVVAIIGMLLSVVITAAQGSKAKSRDVRRANDVQQVQNALELYRTNNQTYPSCALLVINGSSDCLSSSLISEGAISGLPLDPLNIGSGTCGVTQNYHVYCYESGDGLSYNLHYNLETNNIPGKGKGWHKATP